MRLIRISGAILSVLTLALIIEWTVNLYQRDVNDLPLIMALQEEIRIKPEHPGGEQVSFRGLSVNNVLDEIETDPNELSINLAPPDQDLLESEQSPAILPIETSEKNMAASITAALESLLGVNPQSSKNTSDNIELHIASYSTPDKANAHWFLLQQVNSDLLVNYNHQVVKVSHSEKDLYRLRVVGFKSLAVANDMCARLIERGEKCVPAIGVQ